MIHETGNSETGGPAPPGWLSGALAAHAEMAYRVCLRATGRQEDARDAFQNACLGLVRRAGRFRPGTSERAWIAAAMHRAAVDLVRRKAARRRAEREAAEVLKAAEPRPDPAVRAEDLSALRAAMAELPAESRLAIELRYYEGLPDREVGEALEAKPNTAAQRIKRALDALRGKLAARRSERACPAALLLALMGAEGEAQRATAVPADIIEWLGALGRGVIPVPPPPSAVAPAPWLTLKKGLIVMAKNPITYVLLALVGGGVLWISTRGNGGAGEGGSRIASPAGGEKQPAVVKEKGPGKIKAAPRAAKPAWGAPRVLKTADSYRRVMPAGLTAKDGSVHLFVVAMTRNRKRALLATSSRDRGAAWTKMKALSAQMGFAPLLKKGSFHLCAHTGMRGPGGSFGALEYLRISPQGKELKRVKLMPGNENQRYLGARLLGDGGNLVALSTHDPSLGNAPMNTFALRSADGGDSWSKPVYIEKGVKLGDLADFPPCAFMSGKTVGWFYTPGKAVPVTMAISSDAGAAWKRRIVPAFKGESDLKLTRAIPLACAVSGKRVYLALAGFSGKGRGKTKITYYLVRSEDLGKTWEEAKPVSPALTPEDPSAYVTLAAGKGRVAFGYTEVVGRWTQGQMRAHVSLSEDGGRTWFDLHAFDAVEGFSMMPQMAFDEKAGDLHVAAAAVPKGQKAPLVLVRTYGTAPQSGEVKLPAWWKEKEKPKPTAEIF